MRGTDSDAVFFTVVNHPQGNKQVAGLVIAAPSGSNQMEAALVSDDAARFGSTVNPMLDQAVQRVASGRDGGNRWRLDGEEFGLGFRPGHRRAFQLRQPGCIR